ncbi:MAG TPA: glycoside hydrolase family 3 C-terminal domain-containing protein, partial [Acidimicrobiales bacterium]|nr:glycoside hydrolase family 3 C-terminal domain-containing protein [Acidimicrobiales bacterium]
MSDSTLFAAAAARVAGGADAHAEAAALVGAMTEDERRWCLDGDHPFWGDLSEMGQGGYHKRTFPAARVERLGIAGFAFSDGPRGVVIGPATAFPVSMARGATWDVDLEERIGEAIGVELRAVGATLYGGVCVNVLRHPAWGRAQETYGEDPVHVGELGAALTRGVQRHAMACVKHFACNSMENTRFAVDVTIDETALHEVYLPHFRRIVDEGVASVMSAYNAVNGEWCGQSRMLLNDVLRERWGFDGFVISDWIFGLRDAGASVHAGLDVEMPYRMIRAFGLDGDLAAGACTEDEIAAAATRVVATLLRFHPVLDQPRPPIDVLAQPTHRALAREAAAKALVLLRNEPVEGTPVLPLDAGSLTSVAVVGRLAAVRNLGDGGSSDVWAPSAVTPLDGLRAALPAVEVRHSDGDVSVAAGSDVAIVVVGYTKADEGEFIGDSGTAHLASLMPAADEPEVVAAYEATRAAEVRDFQPPPDAGGAGGFGFAKGGDRESLRLRPDDEELIAAVAAANPRVVVCLVAGSAVLIDRWDRSVPAVVQSWYAGMEGGHALADVLLGRVQPSGRLPFSVPADPDHLPSFDRDAVEATYDGWHGYWKLAADGNEAAYPFGFGLSYTDLSLLGTEAAQHGDEIVATTVAVNAGTRPGVEVVQAYASAGDGPAKLVGFARVELDAGERKVSEVRFPIARLARWDE